MTPGMVLQPAGVISSTSHRTKIYRALRQLTASKNGIPQLEPGPLLAWLFVAYFAKGASL